MPDGDLAVMTAELTKSYGRAASIVHAVRGVTLEIHRGERIALLGRSGSGKSTLLNLIGGLDRPTSGSVRVAGRELAGMSAAQRADYRRLSVGFVFQSYNLVATRSALQNVELPLVFSGRPPKQRLAAARQALEAVGLEDRIHHRPAELSGGEQQRVAIARALINRPGLLLADEPTGNLDTATAEQIVALLRTHARDFDATVALVTHDEVLAARFADRVLRMQDGLLME